MDLQNIDRKDHISSDSNYMSPWLSMDTEDWKSLTSRSEVRTYPKNSVIYHQGLITSFVYLVKEGRVRLDTYGRHGKKRSVYIADEGTCFGELSCLDGLPNYCTATTNTKTSLYLIPKELFIEEIPKNPSFAFSLLKSLSLKTRLITGLLEQMCFDDSHYRFYHSLMALIQLYGVKTKENTLKLTIKFTHQELADQTGLSRVSISNIFLSLASKGYIEKEDGFLVIKDFSALEKYLIHEKL